MLQSNPMKAALKEGKVQIGVWLNLMRNPAILTLMKNAGMDYARIDMEHSSPSIETVADMAVLGRAIGLPVVVRPPEPNREWITRLLDCGVWGIHAPQIDNPDAARAVVEAARYRPLGTRGQAGFAPGTDFDRSGGTPAGRAHLNEQVHVTAMFESAEAFRHVDEIVGMEGIDAVTLGPSDLAQELNVAGTPDQAKVIDDHRMILIDAAKRYGKDVAMLVPTLEEAERWIAAGVKIIAYSSDVDILAKGMEEAAKRLKK